MRQSASEFSVALGAIQQPPARYRIIDREALSEWLGVADARLAALQNEWIEVRLAAGRPERKPQWSEAVAVGRRSFVERVQEELGTRALYRQVEEIDGAAVLRDPTPGYRPRSSREMAAPSREFALISRGF